MENEYEKCSVGIDLNQAAHHITAAEELTFLTHSGFLSRVRARVRTYAHSLSLNPNLLSVVSESLLLVEYFLLFFSLSIC